MIENSDFAVTVSSKKYWPLSIKSKFEEMSDDSNEQLIHWAQRNSVFTTFSSTIFENCAFSLSQFFLIHFLSFICTLLIFCHYSVAFDTLSKTRVKSNRTKAAIFQV